MAEIDLEKHTTPYDNKTIWIAEMIRRCNKDERVKCLRTFVDGKVFAVIFQCDNHVNERAIQISSAAVAYCDEKKCDAYHGIAAVAYAKFLGEPIPEDFICD